MTFIPPTSGGSGAGWYEAALWVDASTSLATPAQTGGINAPFKTIQQAVLAAEALMDALPPYTVAADPAGTRNRQRQTIVVAGGIYDENVSSLRGNMFLELLAAGPVVLGDAAEGTPVAGLFESTTPRSLTWRNDQAVEDVDAPAAVTAEDDRRPTLVLGVFPQTGESSSTHTAIASSWKISGDLIFTTGSVTTAEVHLQNVLVVGDVDGSADGGARNCYLYRCKFDGAMDWSEALIQVAESTEFDGPTTISRYGRLSFCEIDGGFTVGGFAPSIPPGGMIACDFNGTFTGPAGSAVMDGVTNYYFKTNGASLAGGATKVIIEDLVA